MAQQEFYTILTTAGLAYEANRKALGLPIKLTQMSVGDGNGAVYNPDATQTALRREVWRGPINALLQDANNPTWLVGELTLPDDVGGWVVREVGFWTDSGILYAVGKYPESLKPLLATGSGKEFYIRAIFQTSNAAEVVLVVDDNVVKATRAFVIDYVAAELAKLDGKRSVRAATTGPIVLSGAQLIDTVAVIAGDRVLVKDQADQKTNGIYVVANGAWVRAADADASVEVTPGLFVPVEEGADNGDSVWQLVTNAPITLGVTGLHFSFVVGPTGVTAGTYRSVTVDKAGRVVGGANPTTLSGYGITDALPAGHLSGVFISNNATYPDTDIDFAPGKAKDSADVSDLILVAATTKRLQAAGAWSPGAGGNGLFTGVRSANTWYHAFLIRDDATGLVDVGFDSSLVAANRPAGYGSFVRLKGRAVKTDASGKIIPFINIGASTYWKSLQQDLLQTNVAAGSVTVTISVPPGVRVRSRHYVSIVADGAAVLVRSPEANAAVMSYLGVGSLFGGGLAQNNGAITGENIAGYCEALTNASSQVVVQSYAPGGFNVLELKLFTAGWTEE